MLCRLLQGCSSVSEVKSINQICSQNKFLWGFFDCLSRCVDYCFAPPAHSNTQLKRSEKSGCFIDGGCGCALGGEASENVPDGYGSQASILFEPSMKAGPTKERSDVRGNFAGQHSVYELCERHCS